MQAIPYKDQDAEFERLCRELQERRLNDPLLNDMFNRVAFIGEKRQLVLAKFVHFLLDENAKLRRELEDSNARWDTHWAHTN